MSFVERFKRALPIAVVAGVLAGAAVIGVLALVDRPTLTSGLHAATISFAIQTDGSPRSRRGSFPCASGRSRDSGTREAIGTRRIASWASDM
jgi:hypothetical protein